MYSPARQRAEGRDRVWSRQRKLTCVARLWLRSSHTSKINALVCWLISRAWWQPTSAKRQMNSGRSQRAAVWWLMVSKVKSFQRTSLRRWVWHLVSFSLTWIAVPLNRVQTLPWMRSCRRANATLFWTVWSLLASQHLEQMYLRSPPKSLGGLRPMGGLPRSLFAKQTSKRFNARFSWFLELLEVRGKSWCCNLFDSVWISPSYKTCFSALWTRGPAETMKGRVAGLLHLKLSSLELMPLWRSWDNVT